MRSDEACRSNGGRCSSHQAAKGCLILQPRRGCFCDRVSPRPGPRGRAFHRTTKPSSPDSVAPARDERRPRDRYYSANQMTLAVLGKESIGQLQAMVNDIFSPVPNRGPGRRPSEKWLGRVKPFLNNQPLQAFNVVPVQVRGALVPPLGSSPPSRPPLPGATASRNEREATMASARRVPGVVFSRWASVRSVGLAGALAPSRGSSRP